jgi:hypothetical protein
MSHVGQVEGTGLAGFPSFWCSPAGLIAATDPPANCSSAWLVVFSTLITGPLGAWLEGVTDPVAVRDSTATPDNRGQGVAVCRSERWTGFCCSARPFEVR